MCLRFRIEKLRGQNLPSKYCAPIFCFYDISVPCEENAKLCFRIFQRKCGPMPSFTKRIWARESHLKEWEFFSTVAASWNYRFLWQIKRCVSFQSNRSHRSAFLWPILTTFGRIILHLAKGSFGWTINRPPITQVVAEDIAVKNVKPQIDRQWPNSWRKVRPVPSLSKIENLHFASKKDQIGHTIIVSERTISVENKYSQFNWNFTLVPTLLSVSGTGCCLRSSKILCTTPRKRENAFSAGMRTKKEWLHSPRQDVSFVLFSQSVPVSLPLLSRK